MGHHYVDFMKINLSQKFRYGSPEHLKFKQDFFLIPNSKRSRAEMNCQSANHAQLKPNRSIGLTD